MTTIRELEKRVAILEETIARLNNPRSAMTIREQAAAARAAMLSGDKERIKQAKKGAT
ncbi:hypothetical protein [Desulfopila sp. IMCC35008]|uniref:hypothetical protein n=1 Tax=Desulfopila sp. IMCC35008 TaxID=2653858 RepID=UPI0013D3FA46|nr:hypothetical protein [Desulfopila sp. IMCC35008]